MSIVSRIRAARKAVVLGSMSWGIVPPLAFFEKYLELMVLRNLLRDLEIDVVLDVGANIGQFARDLRMIGYKGRIVSFEPLIREFNILTKEFSSDSKWTGFNIALGDSDGKLLINVADDSKLSSIKSPSNEFGISSSGVQEIEVKRLDSIFRDLVDITTTRKVFLKIDSQGFDQEVFNGASECIDKIQGLMSELSVRSLYRDTINYKDLLRIYESKGFKLYNLSTVSRMYAKEVVELNCMMTR